MRYILLGVAFLMNGCGGGGGDNATGNATGNATTLATGVFVDSPVSGMLYKTDSRSGITNANGEFLYVPGEAVVFYVGNIQLPKVQGKATITPLDVAGTADINNQVVSNILVFLQSLDVDGNPMNGIVIPPAALAAATTGISFDVSPVVFASNSVFIDLIAKSGSTNKSAIAPATAKAHFQAVLNGSGGAGKINVAPVANSLVARNAVVGAGVSLDGSASSDANNDPLAFMWTLESKPTGSASALVGATSVGATFTPDIPGEYVISLKVNDGQLSSATSKVTVTAGAGKPAPIADAGSNRTVTTGSLVTLDGSKSTNLNGGALTYAWTMTAWPVGSNARLEKSDTVLPNFVVDTDGDYVVRLLVGDASGTSQPAAVTITSASLGRAAYVTTPSVVAGGTLQSSLAEYWKVEFSGSDNGYCDALLVFRISSSAYTDGLCITESGLIRDFRLTGRVDGGGSATLNGVGAATPIFRGTIGVNGVGGGTWDVAGTSLAGSWAATRYEGTQTYPIPSLTTPQAGSLATLPGGTAGIWNRPSVTSWQEFALVTPGNLVAWNAASPRGGLGHVHGDIAFANNTWSLKPGATFLGGSGNQVDVIASGNLVPGSQIVGAMTVGGGAPVTLSFDSYSKSNALAVGLVDIAGTYAAGSVFYLGPDGTVVGTDPSGCRIRGQVSELSPGAKFNMFKVALQYYGTCERGGGGGSWVGFMYWMADSQERYMYSILQPVNSPLGSAGVFSTFFGGRKIR